MVIKFTQVSIVSKHSIACYLFTWLNWIIFMMRFVYGWFLKWVSAGEEGWKGDR